MIIIKCSLCGVEYEQTYNWGEGVVEVAPHRCDLIEVPFMERVCNNGCDSLIRCRRDGFECREAWDTKDTGDYIGGHELYVRGDR